MAKPPRFVRRGKNTYRHAEYLGWACRAIQLEAEDDWFAQVVPPSSHRLYYPGTIGWGTVLKSQQEAEAWCQGRIDEVESGDSLDRTAPTT